MSHARLELLDAAVWRTAALGEQDQVPARLQQPAGGIELGLRAAGAGERKRVQKEADDVAEQRALEPVVGGRRYHGPVAGAVRERVEGARGGGVARIVPRADHRAPSVR